MFGKDRIRKGKASIPEDGRAETATGSPEVGGRKKNLRNLRNLPQSGDVIKTAPLQGNYGNYEN